jgi:hypothetical protein
MKLPYKQFRKNTKQEFGRMLLRCIILSEVKKLVIFLLQSVSAKLRDRFFHVFHLSTAKEMDLFTNKIPLGKKLLPSLYHLWFTNDDYATKAI